MDEGCTQPLSSDPMINLNTTAFFLSLSPVCEESPQLGASRPYNDDHKRSIEVREGRATHKTQIHSTTTHTSHNLSSKYNTRSSQLKSLTQRIKCVGEESGCFIIFRECLGNSFMRLGVPFIAPRQLGAVGGQPERPTCLLSCGAPDSPVHHRTVTVAIRCAISFLL
jgi:hypothetical protein